MGGAAAFLALLAASGKSAEEVPSEGEQPDEDDAAAAGFNPGRYLTDVPEMGRIYESQRGDIMLGVCDKSIAYCVLKDAGELAGMSPQEAHAFAADSARRVAYASLILASPANEIHLTRDLRRNDFRNREGLGIDFRKRPLVWLPIIDLDMVLHGAVVPARYEEDNTLATELPPELREVLA